MFFIFMDDYFLIAVIGLVIAFLSGKSNLEIQKNRAVYSMGNSISKNVHELSLEGVNIGAINILIWKLLFQKAK